MKKYLLVTLFVFLFSPVAAMEDPGYEFRLATEDDLDVVVRLMDEEMCRDQGMILIPKRFLRPMLREAIDQEALFVVSDGCDIVGFKKLFLLSDVVKRDGVLREVIQCSGENAEHIYSGTISYDDPTGGLRYGVPSEKAQPCANPAYLFTSGDFTLRSLRGLGLNKALMQKALDTIKARTIAHVTEHKSDALVLVYGISENNGAFEPGAVHDRTNPIMHLFVPFAREVARATGNSSATHDVSHNRWTSFMPTFDQDADELVPVEGDEVGAGVVLSFPLCPE